MNDASMGGVKLSGLDALSFFYNTKKGGAKLTGAIYWCFHRQVTVAETELNKRVWSMRDTIFIKSFLRNRKITNISTNEVLPGTAHENGCGAQSLRQAADELGVKHLPKHGVFHGESIKDKSAELAIHKATMEPLATGRGDTIKLDMGYASVAQILAAARAMGLKGRLYSSRRNWAEMHLLRPEAEVWRKINGYSSIKLGSVPFLCDQERLLLHCKAGEEGHIVMLRPDGGCYDPGTGKQYSTRAEFMEQTQWKFSGWSILIHASE
ncbi:hypothetical protein [Endozoicomonas sp.]|uniref:hypothetical protein n=1 Tax=Endozoicomonas sp. TaxID=1892382 RepID=UPI00383A8A58